MILQNIKYIDGGIAICGDLIVDEISYFVSERGRIDTYHRDVIHIRLISKAVNKCFIFALRLDQRRTHRLKKLQTKKDILDYINVYNNVWGLFIDSYPINYEISKKDLNIIYSGNIDL